MVFAGPLASLFLNHLLTKQRKRRVITSACVHDSTPWIKRFNVDYPSIKREKARPLPKKLEGETGDLRLTVPKSMIGYLSLLARDSLMGASGNDIAVHLLTKEVQRLFEADAHGKKVPVAEDD